MAVEASPDPQLFAAEHLGEWLGKTVTAGKAVVVERVVWGWLKPVLGLTERPSTVPAEVFSWAIELGAIAHENPAGLSARQLGTSQQQFSAERRAEILDEARGGSTTAAAAGPQGDFPPAPTYPDPAAGPAVPSTPRW